MPSTLHFNTGRHYTASGQRISATLYEDGAVTFFDHDRRIDGEISAENLQDVIVDKVSVLRAYDAGLYTSTMRSWKDGMRQDGPNAKWEG